MEIVNGKVVLGERECFCVNHPAGRGKSFNITYCRNHTKAEGWHNCTKKTCPRNPSKKAGWHELSRTIVDCGYCKGTGIVAENTTDELRLPDDFPIIVLPQNRYNTWNESYLGLGCLYSVTDYGRAHEGTAEYVIAELRERGLKTQACNVIKGKDDMTLCDALAIYITFNGYSVRPYWQEKEEAKVPA